MTMPSPALLTLARIAAAAGQVVMDRYGACNARTKADRSPVTDADEEAEALILKELAIAFAGVPVVAEEAMAAGRQVEAGQNFFLVDPLDGTREFLSGNGEFTVNIAEIVNGVPVMGVVHAPAKERMFLGAAGEGAFETTEARTVFTSIAARAAPEDGLTVVGSRSHNDVKTEEFLKRFTVFNVDQCDGLPDTLTAGPVPSSDADILPRVQSLIDASGADFRIGGSQAYYSPTCDYVAVPEPGAFREPINWHRTALHELGHWTGHPSRLNRDQRGSFGSGDYAREELVAEMASAFACASLSIQPTVRHSDYIGGWLTVLRDDDKAIFRAASAASKAADYLLAKEREMRFLDPESGRAKAMKQFLDDKTYRPGMGEYKRDQT